MPTYSQPARLIGNALPDFSLLGVDGLQYTSSHLKEAQALVVAFICNHCPYVKATLPRMNQLAKEYGSRGVRFIAINSNDAVKYPEDSFVKMQEVAQEQAFTFPYLYDESQQVARDFNAVCTPEFFAYGMSSGKLTLQYHGRLDDNWKDAQAVTRQDLALALDQILVGVQPDLDQKAAMGCSIKWR